jgi:hypothetical protein
LDILLAKKLNVSDISFGWMAPLGRGRVSFEKIGIDENHYFQVYKEVDRIYKLYEGPDFKIGHMELPNCCPIISNEGFIDLNIRIDVFGNVFLCERMSTLDFSLGNKGAAVYDQTWPIHAIIFLHRDPIYITPTFYELSKSKGMANLMKRFIYTPVTEVPSLSMNLVKEFPVYELCYAGIESIKSILHLFYDII